MKPRLNETAAEIAARYNAVLGCEGVTICPPRTHAIDPTKAGPELRSREYKARIAKLYHRGQKLLALREREDAARKAASAPAVERLVMIAPPKRKSEPKPKRAPKPPKVKAPKANVERVRKPKAPKRAVPILIEMSARRRYALCELLHMGDTIASAARRMSIAVSTGHCIVNQIRKRGHALPDLRERGGKVSAERSRAKARSDGRAVNAMKRRWAFYELLLLGDTATDAGARLGMSQRYSHEVAYHLRRRGEVLPNLRRRAIRKAKAAHAASIAANPPPSARGRLNRVRAAIARGETLEAAARLVGWSPDFARLKLGLPS